MRKYSLILIWIFSSTCLSTPLRYTFPITTDIDVNKFYNHDITSLTLKDNSMTAVFDRKSSTFADLSTTLYVDTNIPSSNNIYQHNIRMLDKQNQCFDEKNQPVLTTKQQQDLNSLYISNKLIPINTDVNLGYFSDVKNGFKNQSHTISLQFTPIDPLLIRHCEGSVLLAVSLDV